MSSRHDSHVHERAVGPDELAAQLERAALPAAQGASASADASLALLVANVGYNRYAVQLAEPASPGADPQPIPDALLTASNVGEPFDRPGRLEAGAVVLLWPGQGDWRFYCPAPPDEPAPEEPAATSYWAKIVSGSGPTYTVRRQVPADDDSFQDAGGAENVSAANVWQLTVDVGATAAAPAGAVVRVYEEPDIAQSVRRFFFYPIHAVYR